MQNTKHNYRMSALFFHQLHDGGYGCVPNAILENKELSDTAKVCIAWLIGRPSGWHLIISQMCSALNISERKWSKARKELEAVGLFTQEKLTKPDGKYEWHHWWFTIPTFATDGQAANDETMHGEPTDLALIAKNKDKALHAANMQGGDAHYLSIAARDCGIFNIPNAMAEKWQAAGIKIEQVKEACGKAQKRKGNSPIVANYLDKIVMDYAANHNSIVPEQESAKANRGSNSNPKPAHALLGDAVSEIAANQVAEGSPIYPLETLEAMKNLGIKKTISHP
jgi:hypothetical protein